MIDHFAQRTGLLTVAALPLREALATGIALRAIAPPAAHTSILLPDEVAGDRRAAGGGTQEDVVAIARDPRPIQPIAVVIHPDLVGGTVFVEAGGRPDEVSGRL